MIWLHNPQAGEQFAINNTRRALVDGKPGVMSAATAPLHVADCSRYGLTQPH